MHALREDNIRHLKTRLLKQYSNEDQERIGMVMGRVSNGVEYFLLETVSRKQGLALESEESKRAYQRYKYTWNFVCRLIWAVGSVYNASVLHVI